MRDVMAIDIDETIGEMEQPSIRRRNTLKNHYTMTSNVILFGYRQLGDSEKLTYQAIDSFDWSDGEGKRKGYAFPSVRTLAALRGVDRRTIFRHFAALQQAGLLTREVRPGRPTLLWIEEPSEKESKRYLSTMATGRDTDVTPTRDKNVTPQEESEESSQKQTKPLTAAKAFKGRRGGKRFLSAEESAKREWIASEILDVCGDHKSFAFYREIAAEVPDQRVFEALSEVRLASRESRIRTSRGAYFTSLISRDAVYSSHHAETRDRSSTREL
jgi:hypothetical protein